MSLASGDHSRPGIAQVMLSTRLIRELGDPHSTLRATAQRSGPAMIVRAGGEIDAANEHTWLQLLGEVSAITAPPGPLVVDVNDVEFMGCCALEVLADEAQRCQFRGIDLRLVSHNPGLARVVEACGLDEVLPVHPTTDAALAEAFA
nr:anti-sigma factor antagonist [Mycobacterium sp. 852002-51163_SCH5372311]